ncbi:MAG: DNA polymerase III subunit epsilon [Rhizobiales bacterium]|nr:DNA polymerase III subunit epsilon [Hyphomicrobiales bacterium]
MREIVLDTETTGFDHDKGDRIVEIGCVELFNHIATGKTWHTYINPERDMPHGAFQVHGLSQEFLSDKPLFGAVIDGFLEFIGDADLIIHNAAFDIGFLNMEIDGVSATKLSMSRVIDTLSMARRKNPAGPNSLDALCRRFGIDNSGRTLHGALLDAELLAEVYLELKGGRQAGLTFESSIPVAQTGETETNGSAGARPTPLPSRQDATVQTAHKEAIARLGDGAIWNKYDA